MLMLCFLMIGRAVCTGTGMSGGFFRLNASLNKKFRYLSALPHSLSHTHLHTHACMYVHIHACMHACIACMCIYTHACTHVYIQACIPIYIYTYMHRHR